jgi:hypothetical protein
MDPIVRLAGAEEPLTIFATEYVRGERLRTLVDRG